MGGRITGVLVGILLGAMTAPAAAQSLADVARQEAARREHVKATGKVYTNADLPASAVLAPAGAPTGAGADAAEQKDGTAPAGEGQAPAGAAATPEGKDANQAAPKVAPAPTDDEAGWRGRADRVNTALDSARAEVRQLKALGDRLSLEAQASNPEIAARATVERADLRAQIAKAEEKEAAARADREALVQEARASGVPPAWIQ